MEYYIIIAASVIIILSYFFNWISKKSSFPSVLLLIFLGIILHQTIGFFGYQHANVLALFEEIKLLELLGTLGLIMIVLEAALDLKLEKGKVSLISKAFMSAITVLVATAFLSGYLIMAFIPQLSFVEALIFGTPLSILSSAIVIPSVENLEEEQREFHVYDSTFSDILGIMMFYFLLQLAESSNNALAVGDFTISLFLTIGLSVGLSYLLLYLFQKLEAKVKLFLMTAVLILLFSIGKLMHMSSLIIILIFGLILSNHRIFFSGKLNNLINRADTDRIYEAFHLITMESAFVIRTFFFVIFGFTVMISSLWDTKVAAISGLILVSIYAIRVLLLKIVLRKDVVLATFVAPRGLITLLLFYSIPQDIQTPFFSQGIILYIIIITSLLMTVGLVRFGKKRKGEEEKTLPSLHPNTETDEEQNLDSAPEKDPVSN
ncbi:MAG: cation:proton antiporter [Bacteroidota bacterium]